MFEYSSDPFEAFDQWYGSLSPDQHLAFWGIVALVGAVVGVGFFIYRLIAERRDTIAKGKQSIARDKLAAQVGAALASNETPPPFSLYLRPFVSTGYQVATGVGAGLALGTAASMVQTAAPLYSTTRRLFNKDYTPSGRTLGRALIALLIIMGTAIVVDFILWRTYRFFKLQRARAHGRKLAKNPQVERSEILADFEDLLEDGISNVKRPDLICLGNPGESIGGAGRLRVPDAEWQTYIDRMLVHSSVNVLVLSPRPGTLWEIERVLSTDCWKKTVFIQPPLGGIAKVAYAPESDYQEVRKVFERFGARIPARQDIGVAFGFEELSKPCWARQNLKSADLIAKAYAMIGTNGRVVDRILGAAPAPDLPFGGLPMAEDRFAGN